MIALALAFGFLIGVIAMDQAHRRAGRVSRREGQQLKLVYFHEFGPRERA